MSTTIDLMSSDDSEDDNYNYLSLLDNLSWNKCDTQRKWFPNSDTNISDKNRLKKTTAKNALKDKKPAIAVQTKSNRMAFLVNDMMASKNVKKPDNVLKNSNDVKAAQRPTPKETVSNKRAHDSNEEVIIMSDTNQSNRNNTSNKNKKMRYSQTNYSVESVLASKRANREIATEKSAISARNELLKNERNFGKAFSPTVYPVENPVLLASTSNSIKSKPTHLKAASNFEDNTNKDSKYSADSVLSIILDWKPQWLKDFSQTEIPPSLSPFGQGIGLKTTYESLEVYQSAYIPLILYETWAQIYEEYWKLKKTNAKNMFKAAVSLEYSANDHFIIISFQTTSPKQSYRSDNYAPEGDLIVVELNIAVDSSNESKKLMVFGYVTDFSCENVTPNTHLLKGVVLPQGPSLLLKYTIFISKRTLRLNNRDLIQVRPIYYLKPTIRQIEMISALNSSLLFKDVLKPRHFTCQIVVPTNVSMNNKNFNDSQNRAILGSAEALSRPYPIPKLLLIQGPPGTGKTHTLIGIIKQIYLTWDQKESPRILICAPSNGAVDEIARRLYSERHFLHKSKFKRSLRCVRVGQMSQIHQDVRKISLENLIEDNAENEGKNAANKLNSRTAELESKIAKLDQDIANFRALGQKNELSKAEFEMQTLIKDLQRVGSNPKSVDVNKHKIKWDLMTKSDIVLSTLNSCHQSPIEMLFKNYGFNTFSCVIVDEASQCSEPELLMPLTYKMTKMILIGDPMQLSATVISKRANSLKLGRSLFERFYKYFGDCNGEQKNPILMLDQQYRMHPQICEFPSKHFYDGRLMSSDKVSQIRNDFKIKPYIVFDVTDTQESRNDPSNKFNQLEANFVTKLITIIDNIVHHNYSVGVITPYNGQKRIISDKIKDLTLKVNVEVNTVDGFQGQERDIIILSCVRAFDNTNGNVGFLKSVQRMNVALTRAKYSMILCISGRSLESDQNWKLLIEDAIKRPNCHYKVPSTASEDKIIKMIENPKPSK